MFSNCLRYVVGLLIILYYSFITTITAQTPSSFQFTDINGLPSSTIYSIFQDDKEFIWLGTANGVCRYDGESFKTFYSPLLKDNEILKVLQDYSGTIWFSNLSNQLFYIEDEEVKEFDLSIFNIDRGFTDFILYKDYLLVQFEGDLELYTEKSRNISYISLSKFKDPNYQVSKAILLETCSQFLITDEKLIFKAKHDIYQFKPQAAGEGHFEIIDKDENWIRELDGLLFYNAFAKSGEDKILKTNEYYSFSNTQKRKYKDLARFSLVNDQIWTLTTNGIWIPQSKDELNVTDYKIHIFKGINFTTLIQDVEGNIWLGTSGSGLIFIPILELRSLETKSEFLDNNASFRFYVENDFENLLIGQNGGSLLKITEQDVEAISLGDIGKCQNITKISNGDYLLIFDNEIVRMDSTCQKVKTRSYWSCKDILETEDGNYWIGLSTSCSRLPKENAPIFFNKSKRIPDQNIDKRTYELFYDQDKVVWIGTTSGLYYFQDSIMMLKEEKAVNTYHVSSIIQTADSTLWVSTLGNGILKIKNKKIVDKITVEDGLVSNTCKRLFAHNNYLWIATNDGINKLAINSGAISLIDVNDGLPSNEINDIVYFEGKFWVATSKGVVSFLENTNFKNEHHPPIYITGLKIWDQDTILQESYELPHDRNYVQIDFLGLSYRSKGKIKYKYKLSGIDKDWNQTASKYVRYPFLNPGKYKFSVLAFNEDGVESAAPAVLEFHVLKPWWKTWWASLLLVLLIGGIISSLFFYRLKVLREKEAEREAWNKRVNELKHEALQTQMNPHFVFNALNAIQHYISKNDEEHAMLYLSKFARLIRMIFEQSKRKEISLEEELDFLKYYLSLEKLRFKEKVIIDLNVAENLNHQTDEIMIPPLIIQPVIENAFKHGLFHKKGQGRLNILLNKKTPFLEVIIEDNGIGRERAMEKTSWRNKEGKSSGLQTAKERLLIVNNKIEDQTQEFVEIIDMMDEERKSKGTKVILRIAYRS